MSARKTTAKNNFARSYAELQSLIRCRALGANENQTLDPPYRVVVTHRRYRLLDHKNLNAKAAIDALVSFGVLSGDSFSEVHEEHHQVKIPKTEQEETIIEIYKWRLTKEDGE